MSPRYFFDSSENEGAEEDEEGEPEDDAAQVEAALPCRHLLLPRSPPRDEGGVRGAGLLRRRSASAFPLSGERPPQHRQALLPAEASPGGVLHAQADLQRRHRRLVAGHHGDGGGVSSTQRGGEPDVRRPRVPPPLHRHRPPAGHVHRPPVSLVDNYPAQSQILRRYRPRGTAGGGLDPEGRAEEPGAPGVRLHYRGKDELPSVEQVHRGEQRGRRRRPYRRPFPVGGAASGEGVGVGEEGPRGSGE